MFWEEESYSEMENLIIEAFTQGLTSFSASQEKISRVKDRNLERDDFQYQKWQLELCRYLESASETDIAFSEFKSSVLRKGLIELSKNFREG